MIELPEAARVAAAAEHCGDDAQLLAAVAALLDAERQMPGTAATPAARAADVALQALSDKSWSLALGESVGAYRIEERLGKGGMGEVYRAYQSQPVERQVAVKLLRTPTLDASVIARFDIERQTLAQMSHPAIAQVFDAGSTNSGLPFFVMELVDGIPIDEFVANERPSLRQLLHVFVEVCRGVQHAHQKGVIHRDLKPGNLLVTTVDDLPQPRVIDFGIAKATTNTTTDSALTDVGQIIGTPLYMSPEQADSLGALVDVRSDVYSLGTILYRLLCGQHPLDEDALTSGSVEKRLSTFRDGVVSAPSRAMSAQALRPWQRIDQELDWIVLKTLAFDADERYESAAALADDLQRYLQGLPVEAAPANVGYRLRKFVQRNRLTVFALGAVFLSLLIGLGAATVGFLRATESERRAQIEATNARWVSEFLISLFDASHPDRRDLAGMTARELLDHSSAQLKQDRDALPATRAVLLGAAGRVYSQMFLHEQSLPLLEEADELYRQLPEQAAAHSNVLSLLSRMNAEDGELDKAVDYARRSVALSVAALGENTHETALARQALATSLAESRQDAEALVAMRASLETFKRIEPVSIDVAQAHYNMAGLHFVAGNFEPGMQEIKQAIAVAEEADPKSHWLAGYYQGLAMLLFNTGQPEQSEAPMLKALELARDNYGADNPRYGTSLQTLGSQYHERGKHEQAIPISLEAAEILTANQVPDAADAYEVAAGAAINLGRLDEAQGYVNSAAAWRTKTLSADHPHAMYAVEMQSYLDAARGDYASALKNVSRVLEHRRKTVPDGDPGLWVPQVYQVLWQLQADKANNAGMDPAEHGAKSLALLQQIVAAQALSIAALVSGLQDLADQLAANGAVDAALQIRTELEASTNRG